MTDPPLRDPADSLDFLAMAHYAIAALWAMLSLVPALWVFVAHEVAGAAGLHAQGAPPPEPPSTALVVLSVAIVVVSFLGAALAVWGGLCLSARRRRRVALAAALALCCFVPIGTVLGMITWMFLQRPEIRERFVD